MQLKKYMKKNAVSILMTTSIREAAAMIVEKHVGILPVVDRQGKLVGVVRLRDLLELEMPDFIHLVTDIDFVHDFGEVETTRPTAKLLAGPVTSIMQPVMSIEEESGLLRTYAIMVQNDIYDLPVTSAKGKLVGIVSLVDIGAAVLSMWAAEE